MKVIIAGSRNINDDAALAELINNVGWDVTEVVSGNCHGVDMMGEQWADTQNIPVKQFMADWMQWQGRRPKVHFFAVLDPLASEPDADPGPGARSKNERGAWRVVERHPLDRQLRDGDRLIASLGSS